jgi:hypothetical protein
LDRLRLRGVGAETGPGEKCRTEEASCHCALQPVYGGAWRSFAFP